MLGLADPWVWLAYVFCVASCLLCVVYGAINWNRGDEPADDELRRWAREETKIENEL